MGQRGQRNAFKQLNIQQAGGERLNGEIKGTGRRRRRRVEEEGGGGGGRW